MAYLTIATNYNQTALMFAVKEGHASVVNCIFDALEKERETALNLGKYELTAIIVLYYLALSFDTPGQLSISQLLLQLLQS